MCHLPRRPVYTYFDFVYSSIYFVTIPTAFTLVLCSGVIALTLGDKIKNMQARRVASSRRAAVARTPSRHASVT